MITSNLVNDARFGWSHITLNNGTSWASGVGQFGNSIGIGNGNPAGLDGLLALNFSDNTNLNIGNAETGELRRSGLAGWRRGYLDARPAT
jgi:hypothetical protein